jgi:hypothetical protein
MASRVASAENAHARDAATEICMSGVPMRRLHTWQWAAVAIFAAWFNWTVGHRGLFLYDASIVFDGGWRLLQGQIPYRDYFMSHAPGTYFYEALIFRVFGVSYSSMVLAATILNVIGALLAMRICSRLAPGFDFIAGIGTAIWLQPMTGFLQIEQGAFFSTCWAWRFWSKQELQLAA